MCNISEFIDLLNREMEGLQGYLKGKKEPQTAAECEELVRPFVYKIEKLTAHNYMKDQRIAELKEQLKNAIVPKFKYGQTVWCVYPTNEHRQGFVFELDFVGYTKDKIICCITENEEFEYDEVFATKKEAQAKLKELQGEKK